jgi:hypothetical protein
VLLGRAHAVRVRRQREHGDGRGRRRRSALAWWCGRREHHERGGAIPTTDPCAGYTAPGDPADIAASPREDESAEILAFEVTASAVAPAWAYEKIHADLVAIRAAGPPAIAEIHAVPSVYWL